MVTKVTVTSLSPTTTQTKDPYNMCISRYPYLAVPYKNYTIVILFVTHLYIYQ